MHDHDDQTIIRSCNIHVSVFVHHSSVVILLEGGGAMADWLATHTPWIQSGVKKRADDFDSHILFLAFESYWPKKSIRGRREAVSFRGLSIALEIIPPDQRAVLSRWSMDTRCPVHRWSVVAQWSLDQRSINSFLLRWISRTKRVLASALVGQR